MQESPDDDPETMQLYPYYISFEIESYEVDDRAGFVRTELLCTLLGHIKPLSGHLFGVT